MLVYKSELSIQQSEFTSEKKKDFSAKIQHHRINKMDTCILSYKLKPSSLLLIV